MIGDKVEFHAADKDDAIFHTEQGLPDLANDLKMRLLAELRAIDYRDPVYVRITSDGEIIVKPFPVIHPGRRQ